MHIIWVSCVVLIWLYQQYFMNLCNIIYEIPNDVTIMDNIDWDQAII